VISWKVKGFFKGSARAMVRKKEMEMVKMGKNKIDMRFILFLISLLLI
jgi:hypothetical protein